MGCRSAAVWLDESPTCQHGLAGSLALRAQTLADLRCRRRKRHPFVTPCWRPAGRWPPARSPSQPSGNGPGGAQALAWCAAHTATAFRRGGGSQ